MTTLYFDSDRLGSSENKSKVISNQLWWLLDFLPTKCNESSTSFYFKPCVLYYEYKVPISWLVSLLQQERVTLCERSRRLTVKIYWVSVGCLLACSQMSWCLSRDPKEFGINYFLNFIQWHYFWDSDVSQEKRETVRPISRSFNRLRGKKMH